MPDQQQNNYKAIQRCLNSPDGKVLMGELRDEFDDVEVFDVDPLVMARKAAGRDIYKLLIAMQEGIGIENE